MASPLKVAAKSQERIIAIDRRAAPHLDSSRLAPRLIGLSLRNLLLGNQLAHPHEPLASCRRHLSSR
jgi:hypothetical protein